jgi:putative addiction module component (TIGR02574 family)
MRMATVVESGAMGDKVTELLKQALELPDEARAALASSLLESLEDVAIEEDAELEWAGEIARRVDEIKAGTVKTLPWAEVRRRALARIHGPRG